MMYTPGEGLSIDPKIQEVVFYVKQELRRISDALRVVQVDGINFAVLYSLPTKVQPGFEAYFAVDVVYPGSFEGKYRMNTVGTWVFIG